MKEPKAVSDLRKLGVAVEQSTDPGRPGCFVARGFLNNDLEYPGAVRVSTDTLQIGDCTRTVQLDLWVREYPSNNDENEKQVNAQYNQDLLKKLDRLIAAAELAKYNVRLRIAALKESK